MVCRSSQVDRQACVSDAKAETRQAKKARGGERTRCVGKTPRGKTLCGLLFLNFYFTLFYSFYFALLLSGQVPAHSGMGDLGDAAREGRAGERVWVGLDGPGSLDQPILPCSQLYEGSRWVAASAHAKKKKKKKQARLHLPTVNSLGGSTLGRSLLAHIALYILVSGVPSGAQIYQKGRSPCVLTRPDCRGRRWGHCSPR